MGRMRLLVKRYLRRGIGGDVRRLNRVGKQPDLLVEVGRVLGGDVEEGGQRCIAQIVDPRELETAKTHRVDGRLRVKPGHGFG